MMNCFSWLRAERMAACLLGMTVLCLLGACGGDSAGVPEAERYFVASVPELRGTESDLPKETFVLHEADRTGLDFTNRLAQNVDMNVFEYMYFYNGGGLGAGDFNNDGLVDLFFTSNQEANRLYLNRGELRFEEVTEAAGIVQDGGWSNGVSVVDINGDGLLDLYVSQVGDFVGIESRNQLFIAQSVDERGIPHYAERAVAYGLDQVGFSTQAAFFDYDLDGDLDLFQLNHSIHANGTFGQRKSFLGTKHPLAGDRLLRNEGGRFVEVTESAGVYSNAIGYGLGVVVSDLNLDGFPDLYIGNDFHENDYLYLNQGDGTFREVLTEQMMHTSRFSMGVDAADLNNDAQPEIISLDMLPYDPFILKKSEGEDAYGTFHFKLGYGYNHQYAKNALQLNNGNGTFSEVAMVGGVHATDWSWAPLFFDWNNDGYKDLFVSNGIPKRMNDIDYINFVSGKDIQAKIRMGNLEQKDLSLIDKLPEIKLPNKLFQQDGRLQFQDLEATITNDQAGYSNSVIYADLDGDGDLDLVTNNINERAFLYENKTGDAGENVYLSLHLEGTADNRRAIGAKAIAFRGAERLVFEKYPVRGFQASMEIPLHLGLGAGADFDSLVLIWPDNTYQNLTMPVEGQDLTVRYREGLPPFDYEQLRKARPALRELEDITTRTQAAYQHVENPFVEFNREPLIPHMTSSEGPALAIGDLNGDGRDDIFVGASKRERARLLLQDDRGQFTTSEPALFRQDSIYEDVDAQVVDVNGDGHLDLLVASGGNEYYNESPYLQSRLYLNDGAGNLTRKEDAFEGLYLTADCLLVEDFTGDGFPDLFLGARAVPWAYGELPQSYLLANDGTGKFSDVTADYAPDLAKVGMVKDAEWYDLDLDGDRDLIVAVEWGPIYLFEREADQFRRRHLTDRWGWWNFVLPADFDGDGDIDLIAGNLGLNSRLKASDAEPLRMYYYDFDGNGKKEQIVTYHLLGKEIPFSNMMEIQKQLPSLKKKYLKAVDFAQASLDELFSAEKLGAAQVLRANFMENAILINQGDGRFVTRALPHEAQFTTFQTAQVVDANGDDLPDVLLGGNYYDNNIQMGRLDADYGSILVNRGDGRFEISPWNGLSITGQIRQIQPIRIGEEDAFVLARNDASLKIIQFK
ncbi:MAG: VCBS repeat-containing protein [Bacteroidota bacterium]